MTRLSMAPQCGTRHSESAARRQLVDAVWRPVGFVLLAGMALTILAAVVLLPPYVRLARVRYEHDRLLAKNADDEALVAAYDMLIESAPTDPVLTKRLAICQFGLLPRNEMIVHSGGLPRAGLRACRRSIAVFHLPARRPGLSAPRQTSTAPSRVRPCASSPPWPCSPQSSSPARPSNARLRQHAPDTTASRAHAHPLAPWPGYGGPSSRQSPGPPGYGVSRPRKAPKGPLRTRVCSDAALLCEAALRCAARVRRFLFRKALTGPLRTRDVEGLSL